MSMRNSWMNRNLFIRVKYGSDREVVRDLIEEIRESLLSRVNSLNKMRLNFVEEESGVDKVRSRDLMLKIYVGYEKRFGFVVNEMEVEVRSRLIEELKKENDIEFCRLNVMEVMYKRGIDVKFYRDSEEREEVEKMLKSREGGDEE